MTKPVESEVESSAADAQRILESRVWNGLMDVHGNIFGRLNRALGNEFGITLAKFDVLAQLNIADEGLTQGVLSRRLKVTDGNVTGLVRRLKADGLISRKTLANDRRAFVVQLTSDGAALYRRAKQRHDALLKEWFGSVGDDDLNQLLNLLSVMREGIRTDG